MTASDQYGETSNTSYTVTVTDTTPPLISVPVSEVYEANATGGANIANLGVTATDPVDPNPVLTFNPAGSFFPLGRTQVVATATDAAGNISSESFTVTVVDTTPPSLMLPANVVVPANAPDGAMATLPQATATDIADPNPLVTYDHSSGFFPVGTTVVTVDATDGSGNVSSGTFDVTVQDQSPLLPSLPNLTVSATGPLGTPVTYSGTATDVTDGAIPVTFTPPSGTLFPVGTTIVTATATDAAGNAASSTFNVTIQDNETPVISPLPNITLAATGPGGAVATFAGTGFDMASGVIPLSFSPPSGSVFPIGQTTVTATATDAAGKTAQSSFVVDVENSSFPVLPMIGPITLEATGPTGAVATLSGTAQDIVDGTDPVQFSPASGSVFLLGKTTVTESATDSAGHTSTSSFVVTVEDTTPPIISALPNLVLASTGPGGATANYSATASDLVSGSVPVTFSPPSGTLFPAGTTTVTATATDAAGNVASSAFTVTVVQAPVVTGISLSQGLLTGGTTVTITGSNLTYATLVEFGTTAATNFVIDSATQITATSPAGIAGTVDVTVRTAGGTSATSSADRFTYVVFTTTTSVGTNASVYGQALTLTATVSSTDTAAGAPSGTVQFQIDGTDIGVATALVKGTASIVVPGLNAANYQVTASYSSDTVDFSGSSDSGLAQVSPAPVVLTAHANSDWLLSGQELSVVVTASTTGTLIPDGGVTFYDNGEALLSQPLAVVAEQDQAVLNTTTLPLGRNVITMGYTSADGNYVMASISPVLTEIIFPADAQVLTVDSTSSDPTVSGSLPWAVAQADASNLASVIAFASASGQTFATPQTITLEAPLDLTDAKSVAMEGPSWGVTLVGDYSQSRFPILSVAQDANLLMQGVSIGTQVPGANGDLQIVGVLDVFEPVTNLGSALSLTGGGTVGLGGQSVTSDTLTLTDGSLLDGSLSSGTRTVLSGMVGADLSGSGGLIKDGTGSVVLSGSNDYSGGTTVLAGTLIVSSSASLPAGSSLTIGAGGVFIFEPSQAGGPVAASAVPALSTAVPATSAAPATSTAIVAASVVANAPVAVSAFWVFSPSLVRPVGNLSYGPAEALSRAASDAVFKSYRSTVDRTVTPADNAQSASAWAWLAAIESAWDSSDQNKTTDSAVAALDEVLARFTP